MTCIVAWLENNKVYMGGDSAVSWGYQNVATLKEPKVIRKGKLLIGVSGTAKAMNVIKYQFTPPAFPEGSTVEDYLHGSLVPALRKALHDNNGTTQKDGQSRMDGSLLLGYAGRLFRMSGDFSLVEPAERYHAVGSGEDFALAVLDATQGQKLKPEERLTLALEAAAKLSAFVRAPFHFETLEGK